MTQSPIEGVPENKERQLQLQDLKRKIEIAYLHRRATGSNSTPERERTSERFQKVVLPVLIDDLIETLSKIPDKELIPMLQRYASLRLPMFSLDNVVKGLELRDPSSSSPCFRAGKAENRPFKKAEKGAESLDILTAELVKLEAMVMQSLNGGDRKKIAELMVLANIVLDGENAPTERLDAIKELYKKDPGLFGKLQVLANQSGIYRQYIDTSTHFSFLKSTDSERIKFNDDEGKEQVITAYHKLAAALAKKADESEEEPVVVTLPQHREALRERNATIEELRGQLQAALGENVRLQEAKEAQATEIETLRTRGKQAEGQVAYLKEEVRQLNVNIDGFLSAIKDIKEKVGRIVPETREKLSDRVLWRAEKDNLKARIGEIGIAVSNLPTSVIEATRNS